MQQINWNVFRAKHEDPRAQFELLCYHLFCRRLKVVGGAWAEVNHPGLETDPVLADGELHGFQAKFFDHQIDYANIFESIKKAITLHPDLTEISVYVNLPVSTKSAKLREIYEQAFEAGISINWVSPSNFQALLSESINLDLAQLFFGIGTELDYLLRELNVEKTTLINSNSYMPIDTVGSDGRVVDLKQAILQETASVSMLIGNPGSGKSLEVYRLFMDLIGLRDGTASELTDKILSLGALPILVDLKNCARMSLETVLSQRKIQYRLGERNLKIIYIFDGLDELSERDAEETLSFATELSRQTSTKKIVISCRSGNINRRLARGYFKGLVEYNIAELKVGSVRKLFEALGDETKLQTLDHLINGEHPILESLVDVLVVRLFWDSIEDFKDGGTVVDLLGLKVKSLLNSAHHLKGLARLNLPDSKDRAIIDINKDIALEMQRKFHLRIKTSEVQSIISDRFPRNDYRSVNEITQYLAELFFDHEVHYSDTFIFKHRRYLEYFLVRKLRDIFLQSPKALRPTGVLANHDLIANLFIPFLRTSALEEASIPHVVEASAVSAYLSRADSDGVRPYYLDAPNFVSALVSQRPELYDEIMSDERFNAAEKFTIDVKRVSEALERISHGRDFSAENFLADTWQDDVRFQIGNIRKFHEAGHEDFAQLLLKNLNDVHDVFHRAHYQASQKRRHLRNPFVNGIEDWCYVKVVVEKKTLMDVLKKFVRVNLKNQRKANPGFASSLLNAFSKIAIMYKPDDLEEIANELVDIEVDSVVNVAADNLSLIKIVYDSALLSARVKKRLHSVIVDDDSVIPAAFFKALFEVDITSSEIEFLKNRKKEIINEREMDWHFRDMGKHFVLSAFVLNDESFDKLMEGMQLLPYFSARSLYAAVFKAGVELVVKREGSLNALISKVALYVRSSEHRSSSFLTYSISKILAQTVGSSLNENTDIQLIRNSILDDQEDVVGKGSFMLELFHANRSAYKKVVTDANLSEYAISDYLQEELPDYVDHLLRMAMLYAPFDPDEARLFFYKAASEGTLRHGWRKDSIVAVGLVNSLELLWEHSLLRRAELKATTEQVLQIVVRVAKITDGKGTWQGPRRLLNAVSKHDHRHALELAESLIKIDSTYRDDSGIADIKLSSLIRSNAEIKEIEDEITRLIRPWAARNSYGESNFLLATTHRIALATNPLYSESERRGAFARAYDLALSRSKKSPEFFKSLTDQTWQSFIELCELYEKPIPDREPELKNEAKERPRDPKMSEAEFLALVQGCDTAELFQSLLSQLEIYENTIVLRQPESWRAIVLKAVELTGSIDPILEFLDRSYYPRSNYFTANSQYFQYVLGELFRLLAHRKRLLEFLADKSGHGGFENVIQSLIYIGDRDTALYAFQRYVAFCELLVE